MSVAQLKHVESVWRWVCNYCTWNLGMGELQWL